MTRTFGFDFARTLAIGLVVLSHAHQGSHLLGFFGVELFFALSGFLIGGILYRSVPETGPWSPGGVALFWKRRWWRTLPNYFLFLLISIGFHFSQGELPPLAELAPFFCFSQYLTVPNGDFFGVSWSLCVEEWFYLLFPLILFGFHRITRSRRAAFAWASATFIIGAFAFRSLAALHYSPEQTRVMTLPRLDAIGYGVGMAVVVRLWPLSRRGRAILFGAGAAGVAAISVALAARNGDFTGGLGHLALVVLPLSFSLGMPLFSDWRTPPPMLSRLTGPVTAISLWSYSIYLCHYPILMSVYSFFGDLRQLPGVNLLSKFVGLAITLLVARTVFRYFESPITRLRPSEPTLASPPFSPAAP